MKNLKLVLSISALALFGMADSALADGKACAGDIKQFCSDATGWKEIGACLKQNESQLSAGCTAARAKRKAKWEARKAEFQTACGSDVTTYCSNQAADKKSWEVFQCLRTNENSISAACKAELAKRHKHHRHHGNPPATGSSGVTTTPSS